MCNKIFPLRDDAILYRDMDFHKMPRQEQPPTEESLDTVFAQAETRLRDFIAQAKPVREGGEAWEEDRARSTEGRLDAGTLGIQKRYLHGLSSTAGGAIGAKKDGVMSAVLAYEFAHRQEYPLDEPYISKRHLLSVWAKYAGLDQDLQCKKVAARCLANIPIEECVEALTVKNAKVEDIGLLVKIALERKQKGEEEGVYETLAKSFFNEQKKIRTIFAEGDYVFFPAEFIASAVEEVKKGDQEKYRKILEALAQIFKKDPPLSDHDLSIHVKGLAYAQSSELLAGRKAVKYLRDTLFPLVEGLAHDVDNYGREVERRVRDTEATREKKEFADLIRGVVFDSDALEDSIVRYFSPKFIPRFVDIKNAPLRSKDGRVCSIKSVNDRADSPGLLSEEDMRADWQAKREDIKRQIENYFRERIPHWAQKYVADKVEKNRAYSNFENTIQLELEDAIELAKRSESDALAEMWLGYIQDGFRETLYNLAREKNVKERERVEGIPVEYLKKLIELKTGYLKELYEAGLGLTLPNVAIHGIHERGSTVGSVWGGSVGGLGMRLEQRLSLEFSVEGALHLEIGETLDDMLHREAMVDWVGPHEIAHLVDEERNYTNICTSGETAEKLQQFIGTNDAPFAANVAQEVVIDALGYAMVKQFGSSDPRDREPRDRIAKAVQGFLVMCEMSRDIIERSSDGDKKAYLIQTLRLIAVGEVLEEDAKSHTVRGNILDELRGELRLLEGLILRHQRAAMLFARPQQKEFIRLCKEFFIKIKIEE